MLASLVGVAFASAAAAQNIGPSTTTEPYVLPSIAGVSTMSLLTTGDKVGGYRLVGIPDGTGAWAESGKAFNLVVNHELGVDDGIVRAHGSKGAFVSRWLIDTKTGKVLSGRDHLTSPSNVLTWAGATYWRSGYKPGTTAFESFCSADLASKNAFFLNGQFGTAHRIYLNGEETTPPDSADHGRAFAHIVTGPEKDKSYELPRLGKMSFENVVASPYRQAKTIVALNDDGGRDTDVTLDDVCRELEQEDCKDPPSELSFYVGTKQATGTTIERAGLTNGSFCGMRVTVNGKVVTGESKDYALGSSELVTEGRFALVGLGDVSGKTGVAIQDELIDNRAMQFIRVEDGAWDPRAGKGRDYYFVTTGRIRTDADSWRPSRLWRVRFDDITHPEKGGTIQMLLTNAFYPGAGSTPDADPTYQSFDNIAIDGLGRIVLQEDVGDNDRLGRIYVYGIDSKKLVEVARHNGKLFTKGKPAFIDIGEESSGVIDAAHVLGTGWFLMDVQVGPDSDDPELVAGGQLLKLYVDPSIAR